MFMALAKIESPSSFGATHVEHSAPTELRKKRRRRVAINISLERQEKLGVSDWVKVPVEKV